MVGQNYWKTVNFFTATEAATLVLGIAEIVPGKNAASGFDHLIRQMKASFIDTCAHLRFCLEADRDWTTLGSWEWHLNEADISFLPSTDMRKVADQAFDSVRKRDFFAYKEYGLDWLDTAIDRFDEQSFSREDLREWITWMGVSSEYKFEAVETVTPEARREAIREMVAQCNGNKAEAARQLGISRQRVDQLLSTKSTEKRKPLNPFMQDPFGRSGSSEGNASE